jgi:hydroxyacylglutathione hydrolase
VQVSEHIHALKIGFQVRVSPQRSINRFVFVYLIYGRDRICLIDSGIASSEGVIFDYLGKTGRDPRQISLLILTHSHPDHIGGARAVQEGTGCAVASHAEEKTWIEDVELQARERPVPGFHSLVGGSVRVDRTLAEGENIELDGGIGIQVFHTPGHSRGSISLWVPGERTLICGDAVPLAGDLPIYDDVLASVDSIKKLKGIEGIDLLLASWDDPRQGRGAYQVLDESLRYLQRIQDSVNRVAGENVPTDPLVFCQQVLEDLGLSGVPVNPLVARSFQAHLIFGECQDWLS